MGKRDFIQNCCNRAERSELKSELSSAERVGEILIAGVWRDHRPSVC